MLEIKELFSKLLLNYPRRGFYEGTSISAGGYADFTVPFDRTFATVPTVVVTLCADTTSTTSENAKVEPFVINATTSNFKVRIFNSSSIARTPAFTWIAVGKFGGGGVLLNSILRTLVPVKGVGVC